MPTAEEPGIFNSRASQVQFNQQWLRLEKTADGDSDID
ncbi:MAG: hypothetical protein ACI89X_004725 [Planctomycetota bacterium]